MTYNYHHHDHGIGRVIGRVFWGFILFWALWMTTVLFFWNVFAGIAALLIVGGVILIIFYSWLDRQNRHNRQRMYP